MEGFFYNKTYDNNNDKFQLIPDGIQLLAKCDDLEVVKQTIVKGATVWLYPANDKQTMEFFFLHKGELEIELDGKTVVFYEGDSFSAKDIKSQISLKANKDTTLVYVSNQPMYEEAQDFESYIKDLISQINDKDHYTYQHSANVMHYSILVFKELYKEEHYNEAVLNDLVIASLFHDVGKCFTPDEILKKKGRLTPEEFKIICHHPLDSARLLRRHYGERVAEIAGHHHERLDGSGYPFGLRGDEISPEAKILSAVDAFDAMTTSRGYNVVKSFEVAAEELCSLPNLFDTKVTGAIKKLVDTGIIDEIQEVNDAKTR